MNNINYITIQKYLEGSLDENTMHQLERQALEDPFLADALEGYAKVNFPAGKQLSLLQSQLETKIAQLQENKNTYNFSWQRLSIAATAGLLFILASILFFIKGNLKDNFASNHQKIEISVPRLDNSNSRSLKLKNSFETAKPVAGWEAYRQYVKKYVPATKMPLLSGEVILSFVTDTKGAPININIENSLKEPNTTEAIRLLKNGPVWKPGSGKRMAVVIHFNK